MNATFTRGSPQFIRAHLASSVGARQRVRILDLVLEPERNPLGALWVEPGCLSLLGRRKREQEAVSKLLDGLVRVNFRNSKLAQRINFLHTVCVLCARSMKVSLV